MRGCNPNRKNCFKCLTCRSDGMVYMTRVDPGQVIKQPVTYLKYKGVGGKSRLPGFFKVTLMLTHIAHQYNTMEGKNLMQRNKLIFVISILMIMLVGTFLPLDAARATSSVPKIICKQWNYFSSPNPNGNSSLNGVAAISASDVWAVGSYLDSNSVSHTLIEQWNGTSWSIIPSPDGSTYGSGLSGIAAISATDIWAVGHYSDGNLTDHTLIEQWNGASWNIIPSPDGNITGSGLSGIAAVSATDIWAVGQSAGSNGPANSLIEHWNGSQWNVVANPNKAGAIGNALNSIVAISSNDVWAAGDTFYSSGNTLETTLIEKWNGTRWKIVSSPNSAGNYNSLNGIAAISSKNVWVAGATYFSNYTAQALIEKWNGISWSIIPSPNPSSSGLLYLAGIAAISNTNIWAVGYYYDSSGNTNSLIEHWNGNQWTIVSGSNPGSSNSMLSGVVRIPGTSTLWAVGAFGQTSIDQTLTEYHC